MATQTAIRPRKPRRRAGRVTRANIIRRAERILRTEPHYIYNSCFDGLDAASEILGPPPASESDDHSSRVAEGVDFYLAFLYRTELLSREEEYYFFRKMNYLKFSAYRLRQGLDPETATRARVEEIEGLEEEAVRIRNHIIESNLRLVTARAKQFARTTGLPLDELISEGNIGLVQAVEHFDFSRGTKLSTYATWAITNKLLAYFQKARRQSSHFISERGELLEGLEGKAPEVDEKIFRSEVRALLTSLMRRLKDRERVAIENRFGLTKEMHAITLKELAGQWGVTKQRAQQVCAGAVNKLRIMLEEVGFELPED